MSETSPLAGKEVALAGRLFSMTRAEAVGRLTRAGALIAREPGPATDILVAGSAQGHLTSDGGVPRSIALFKELKKQGAAIRLIEEPELLRLIGDEDDLEDFSRLYTMEQVSRIVEAPLPEVRAWVRRGLLQPSRVAKRLAWFEFSDILVARTLSRLNASGVPASQILRSLSEIARWLPDGNRILGRLEAYAAGLRVRLSDGGLAEPSGQMLIDFADGGARVMAFPSSAPRGPVVARERLGADDDAPWLSLALESEEQGDLEAAVASYERALRASAKPETFFNLGNALYALGREAEAAERYLKAIEADHDFAEAWNNLGNSLVALGKLQDAVQAYRMALSLEPTYAEPRCNLAVVLSRMGEPGEALAHKAACQKSFPSAAHLSLLRRPSEQEDE